MEHNEKHQLMYDTLVQIAANWNYCINVSSVGEMDNYYGFSACQLAMGVLDVIGDVKHDCGTCIDRETSRKIAPCIDCNDYELWSIR